MSKTVLNLIYLRSGGRILSKKHYGSWKEILNEYDDYMANLTFDDYSELIEFFEEDFREECDFPLSREEILKFAESDDIVLSD